MTEAQTPALEPCPKCQSANIGHDQFSPEQNRHVISCNDCDWMTATYETAEEADQAWNTRAKPAIEPVAHPPADRALLDEVREQAEREAEARIVAWLRGQADRNIVDSSFCRSGNAGASLRRSAQRRRDDALAIEQGAHKQ